MSAGIYMLRAILAEVEYEEKRRHKKLAPVICFRVMEDSEDNIGRLVGVNTSGGYFTVETDWVTKLGEVTRIHVAMDKLILVFLDDLIEVDGEVNVEDEDFDTAA